MRNGLLNSLFYDALSGKSLGLINRLLGGQEEKFEAQVEVMLEMTVH